MGLLENIQRNKSYLQRSNRGRTFIISLASATTIFNWHSPFGFCPRERKKNTNIIIYWQSLADTGGNSGGRHKLTQDIASALAKTAHTTQVNWTFNILIVFHLFLPLGARIFSHSKMYRYSLSSVYAIAKQVKLQAISWLQLQQWQQVVYACYVLSLLWFCFRVHCTHVHCAWHFPIDFSASFFSVIVFH